MSRIRLAGAVVGLTIGLLMYHRPFARMPAISQPSAGQVLVGDADDHVRYVIGQRYSFDAVTLDYDVSFFGGGLVGQLGGRATLACVDDATYATVRAAQSRGQCAGGVLGQCQRNGKLNHFILIPADEKALSAMKSARLKSGRKFRLTGSQLTYHSAQSNGQPMSLQMSGTSFFLVESIRVI